MKKSPSRGGRRRPLVGVAADGASGYGRAVIRGVMRYANAERRWLIHDEWRRTFEPRSRSWPACDGAIAGGVSRELFEQMRARSRHVVTCSGSADPAESPIVCLDDVAAGAVAAEHLLDCRLERFGFYGLPGVGNISTRRREGFVAALQARGYTADTCPVPYPDFAQHATRQHWPDLIDWLRRLPKPVGILGYDDNAAHDLAAACVRADIAVPEQVAIVGVNDDDLLCESAWPPLSSVNADYSRVGYTAAQMLDKLMAGQRLTAEQRLVRLPPLGVVRRQSTDVLAIDDPQLADAIRFIREHACEPCTVADVLREVPTGRRWLERQFVKKLGRTPHDEILRVQLEAAKRLLLQPNLALPDIAERCGFASNTTFGRAFRRSVGITPTAYRRASSAAL